MHHGALYRGMLQNNPSLLSRNASHSSLSLIGSREGEKKSKLLCSCVDLKRQNNYHQQQIRTAAPKNKNKAKQFSLKTNIVPFHDSIKNAHS